MNSSKKHQSKEYYKIPTQNLFIGCISKYFELSCWQKKIPMLDLSCISALCQVEVYACAISLIGKMLAPWKCIWHILCLDKLTNIPSVEIYKEKIVLMNLLKFAAVHQEKTVVCCHSFSIWQKIFWNRFNKPWFIMCPSSVWSTKPNSSTSSVSVVANIPLRWIYAVNSSLLIWLKIKLSVGFCLKMCFGLRT